MFARRMGWVGVRWVRFAVGVVVEGLVSIGLGWKETIDGMDTVLRKNRCRLRDDG
jgi:hypothetical protein